MKFKKHTYVFIVAIIVLIAIWDVYVLVWGGPESSISHIMINWAYDYPVFSFVMGFVMGHLFWRMGGRIKEGTKDDN